LWSPYPASSSPRLLGRPEEDSSTPQPSRSKERPRAYLKQRGKGSHCSPPSPTSEAQRAGAPLPAAERRPHDSTATTPPAKRRIGTEPADY
jgi:hypothetical protein